MSADDTEADRERGLWVRYWMWRNARRFRRVGAGCVFPGTPLDVDGHVELGAGCVVRGNVVIRTHRDGVVMVGDRVELSDYAMVHSNDRVEIGDDTCIGPFSVLRDNLHLFQGTDVHWRRTPPIIRPIIIGAGCFVGARSYVMPGVHIGEGAVVAPGSIITRDVGPFEVWAGSPSAQFVAHRTDPKRRSRLRRHLDAIAMFGFRDDPDTV